MRRRCTRRWPSRSPPAARIWCSPSAARCAICTTPCRRRGAAAHVAGAAELLPLLEAELRPGDTLLVKGSLGIGMGRLVDALLADPAPVGG